MDALMPVGVFVIVVIVILVAVAALLFLTSRRTKADCTKIDDFKGFKEHGQSNDTTQYHIIGSDDPLAIKTMPAEWLEQAPDSSPPGTPGRQSPHTVYHGVNRPMIPGLNASSDYDPIENPPQVAISPATRDALLTGSRNPQASNPSSYLTPARSGRSRSRQDILAHNDEDSLFGDSDPETDMLPPGSAGQGEYLMTGAIQPLPLQPRSHVRQGSSQYHSDIVESSDYQEYHGADTDDDQGLEDDEEEEYEPRESSPFPKAYEPADETRECGDYDPSKPWIVGGEEITSDQQAEFLTAADNERGETLKEREPTSPSEAELQSKGFEFHCDIPEDVQMAKFWHFAFREALRTVEPNLSRKQQWYVYREVEKELKTKGIEPPVVVEAKSINPASVKFDCGCGGDTEKCIVGPWNCLCNVCDHSDDIDRYMHRLWKRGNKLKARLLDRQATGKVCNCHPSWCHCYDDVTSDEDSRPGFGRTYCYFRRSEPFYWRLTFPEGELLDKNQKWGVASEKPPIPWKIVSKYLDQRGEKEENMTREQRSAAILEFYSWEQQAEALKGNTPKTPRQQQELDQDGSAQTPGGSRSSVQASALSGTHNPPSLGHSLSAMILDEETDIPISRPDTPRPTFGTTPNTPYASDINHDSVQQSVEAELPPAQWHRESTPAYEDRSFTPSPISRRGDVEMRDASSNQGRSTLQQTPPSTSAGPRQHGRSMSPAKPPLPPIPSSFGQLKQPKRNDKIKPGTQGSKTEKRSVTGSPTKTSGVSKSRNITRKPTSIRPPPEAIERALNQGTDTGEGSRIQEGIHTGGRKVSDMVSEIEAREKERNEQEVESVARQRDGTPVRRSSRPNKGVRSSPGYGEEFS